MTFPAVDVCTAPLLCLGAAGIDSCSESTQPAVYVRIGMVSRPRVAESHSNSGFVLISLESHKGGSSTW